MGKTRNILVNSRTERWNYRPWPVCPGWIYCIFWQYWGLNLGFHACRLIPYHWDSAQVLIFAYIAKYGSNFYSFTGVGSFASIIYWKRCPFPTECLVQGSTYYKELLKIPLTWEWDNVGGTWWFSHEKVWGPDRASAYISLNRWCLGSSVVKVLLQGPRFSSQHAHGGPWPSVTPVPVIWHFLHTWHRHTCSKTSIHAKKTWCSGTQTQKPHMVTLSVNHFRDHWGRSSWEGQGLTQTYFWGTYCNR